MKEENEDNVKITTVTEITSKNLNDNIKNNSYKQSKQKKNNNNSKKLYIYIIIYLFIIFYLVINFIYTNNSFNENKNINFLPQNLCNKILNLFFECIKNKNENNLKCNYENKAIEDCYDETIELNHICKFYISGLELCIKKNKNKSNLKQKCKNELNDIIICGRYYKFLELDQDKLINYLINYEEN